MLSHRAVITSLADIAMHYIPQDHHVTVSSLAPHLCILSEACCCKAGTDVARKVVILARECNLKVELHDVEVQSLVPEPLRDSPSAEAFLEGLPQASLYHSATYQQCSAAQHKDVILWTTYRGSHLRCCAALSSVPNCNTMTC